MIGSGLKKLAKQNGMSVSNGVAYGSLKGFATTMSEGNGYKLFEISTTFPSLHKRKHFTQRSTQLTTAAPTGCSVWRSATGRSLLSSPIPSAP